MKQKKDITVRQENNQPLAKNMPDSQQPAAASVQPPQVKVKKKYRHVKLLLVIVLCEILIGAGVAAYLWRDNKAIEQQNADAETILQLEQEIKDLNAEIEDYDVGADMNFQGGPDDFSDY